MYAFLHNPLSAKKKGMVIISDSGHGKTTHCENMFSIDFHKTHYLFRIGYENCSSYKDFMIFVEKALRQREKDAEKEIVFFFDDIEILIINDRNAPRYIKESIVKWNIKCVLTCLASEEKRLAELKTVLISLYLDPPSLEDCERYLKKTYPHAVLDASVYSLFNGNPRSIVTHWPFLQCSKRLAEKTYPCEDTDITRTPLAFLKNCACLSNVSLNAAVFESAHYYGHVTGLQDMSILRTLGKRQFPNGGIIDDTPHYTHSLHHASQMKRLWKAASTLCMRPENIFFMSETMSSPKERKPKKEIWETMGSHYKNVIACPYMSVCVTVQPYK